MLRRIAKREGKLFIGIAITAFAGLLLWTSYYQIQPDEVGVVLRFGKHVGNTDPGLHFRLPLGVDRVIKVPVERQLKMEFGFRTVRAGIQSEFARGQQARAEAKMLSADRNVAIVEWIVQYKIASAEKYLFNFRDIDTTLRLMSEAAMRSAVGDFTIDELITGGREQVEGEARQWLEQLNKLYDTGIIIQQLKLQDANVPEPVKASLREVEEAKQEMQNSINLAEKERNRVLPEARGKAKEIIAAAEGYQYARVNEALGDANRFNALQNEYRKAKDVTRTRLYMETLTEVLPGVKKKYLVDSATKNIIPLLNLTGAQP